MELYNITNSYQLTKRDFERIESLSLEMWRDAIHFDYHITILYDKPVTDETLVMSDNRHLRKLLRTKYKNTSKSNDSVKFLFTLEKHLKNDQSKWFNSYHRHILMSEINGVSCEDLENFIRKHHKSVSRDLFNEDTNFRLRKGVVVEPVEDFNIALSYVTKQIEYPRLNVDREKVIDTSNSDIGKNHYSTRGESRENRFKDTCTRQSRIPKGSDQVLSMAY